MRGIRFAVRGFIMLQALAVVFLVLSLSIARAETPAEVAAQADVVADLEASKLLLDARYVNWEMAVTGQLQLLDWRKGWTFLKKRLPA
jgi:hypothetical protein